MKHILILGYVVLVSLTMMGPADAITFQGTAVGSWVNVIHDSNDVYSVSNNDAGGNAAFEWGTPGGFGYESSRFVFDGVGSDAVNSHWNAVNDTPFVIGSFSYRNGTTTIASADGILGVDLNVRLSITSPFEFSKDFTFAFHIINTPNHNPVQPIPDADIVTVTSTLSSAFFTYNGIDYTLELLGFSTNNGRTIRTDFSSPEFGTANAKIYGRIVLVGDCPLVKLYVAVTDQAGHPVPGLTAADFIVKDGGVTLTSITASAAQSEPIYAKLVLDHSGTMMGEPTDYMQNAAISFLNRLGTQDFAEIIKFSQTVNTVAGFTSDKDLLAEKITESWGGEGKGTALYDAIYRAIGAPNVCTGRMAFIVMTDGRENASIRTLTQVIDLVKVKGVPSLFFIGMGDVDRTKLRDLAAGTGGQYYYAQTPADLQEIYDRIDEVINNQYIITCYTPDTGLAAPIVTSGRNIVTTSTICSGCNGGSPLYSLYEELVQKIYIGYYQRPADPAGLIFWANELDKADGDLNAIIDAFAHSPESRTLYGTINSGNIATVVNAVYKALFGHDADDEGLKYYVGRFNAGEFTAATIMLDILNGAQNEDLQTVNNKLEAAALFTTTIDPELDGKNFHATYALGDESAGRNFLVPVNWNPTTVPTQAQTILYIRSHIADPGDPIVNY